MKKVLMFLSLNMREQNWYKNKWWYEHNEFPGNNKSVLEEFEFKMYDFTTYILHTKIVKILTETPISFR